MYLITCPSNGLHFVQKFSNCLHSLFLLYSAWLCCCQTQILSISCILLSIKSNLLLKFINVKTVTIHLYVESSCCCWPSKLTFWKGLKVSPNLCSLLVCYLSTAMVSIAWEIENYSGSWSNILQLDSKWDWCLIKL